MNSRDTLNAIVAQVLKPSPLCLTYPPEHWEIFDERRDLRLIVVHELSIELIGKANGDGIDESKTTWIKFRRTRQSWQAAWRIARLLANASQGLKACIYQGDLNQVVSVTVGQDLVESYTVQGWPI